MALWVVRIADNVILRDKSGEALVDGEMVVEIPGIPDFDRHRYDATSESKVRLATASELLAVEAERKTITALLEAGREVVRALLLYDFRNRMGRNPNASERDVMREAFIQAYKDVT